MKKALILTLIISALSLSVNAAEIWVDIQDFNYTPLHLYVPVGTVVKWTNYDQAQHSVTSDVGLFDSGLLPQYSSWSYTFNSTGNFDYHCTPHPMMTAMVHVRTTAQLSMLLAMNPVGSPIVIPVGGGSFQYQALGTNRTTSTLNITYWTKLYFPNNTFLQTFLKNVSIPGMGSRGATLTQSVAGTAPAGLYHFFGYIGTNPDSAIAWNGFTFTKAVAADGGNLGGFESVLVSGWEDISADTQPVNTSDNTSKQSLKLWNSPEPFNPSTVINYSLPQAGQVQLDVFNVTGARVATLVNGYRNAGQHQVTFDASNLPSGLYVYRMNTAGETISNKMMLVK